MLLYSTLLCKKIARAPGGHKNLCSLSWGGGDRIDPNINYKVSFCPAEPRGGGGVNMKPSSSTRRFRIRIENVS